ncbi:hypothetical protein OUZ56_000637 [Daphnia magna]|uniref:Uncharacterized protein n=1 Tax=Daphnia magna TaxID=35525 RepID=A0ABR0A0D1_9CRUS|nr:hypothetical protein OUZ56_000637 [Daphnia magna]
MDCTNSLVRTVMTNPFYSSNTIVFHTILLVVGTSWNKLHLTFERYLHLGLCLKNIVAKCPSKAVMLSYQLKVNTGCPILASWKSVFPLMFQQGMNFDISLPSLGVSLVIFDQLTIIDNYATISSLCWLVVISLMVETTASVPMGSSFSQQYTTSAPSKHHDAKAEVLEVLEKSSLWKVIDQMPNRRFPCKMNVKNPRRSVPQNERLKIILNHKRHQVKRDFKMITVGNACGNFDERYLNVTFSH